MSRLASTHPSLSTTASHGSNLCNPTTPSRTAIPFPSLLPPSQSKPKRPSLRPLFAAPPPPPEPSARSSSSTTISSFLPLRDTLIFVFFFSTFLCLRLLFGLLPHDFSDRWHRLLAFSEEAESECAELPSHLIQAVVANEDRRFFRHFGVDPFGLARAVVCFPRGGGGSTITQQLVKNVFLKSERKISRKVVEMVLAMIVERKMSKMRILYSYMCKVYWGHGRYGIKSASLFYFGKHPSLLSLGESATLAGILPAPELLSPFKHSNRGKLSQARALKKMVAVGFLDTEAALLTVSEPLSLNGVG